MNFSNLNQNNANNTSDIRNKIISFLKAKGPSLPYEIATLLKKDIIIASAFLSELISAKIVKMSNLKIGSSPLYYLPGQESMLEKFTDHLKGNELEAYSLIKKRKLLKDSELEPKERVSMGFIRDFASPIKVITPEGETVDYWKFYLLGNDEASKMLSNDRKGKDNEQTQNINPNTQQILKQKVLTEDKEKNKKINKETRNPSELSEDNKKHEENNSRVFKDINDDDIKEYSLNKLNYYEESAFFKKLVRFIIKKEIKASNFSVVKKSNLFEFDAVIKNDVTDFRVHCIAKAKKSIYDQDAKSMASNVFDRKMVTLLITNGKITKKAQETFDSNNLLRFVLI